MSSLRQVHSKTRTHIPACGICYLIFAFLLIHLIPGDPVRVMLGSEADEAAVVATRAKLNLDKPLPVQYWLWIKGVFQGDFGRSLY
jgi:peptide/nickel transport system permease protein